MRIHILSTGLVLLLAIATSTFAQEGSTSVGLRVSPDGLGVTGKYFIGDNVAFESQFNAGGLMSGEEGRSYTAAGLLVYHITLPDPRWKVFFGGGVHGGIWDHGRGHVTEGEVIRIGREMIFGAGGIGGVEYKLSSAPVSFSADFRPAINLASEVDFFSHNMFGLTARLYLDK